MRLIVSSKEDKASENILSHILKREHEEVEEFEGNPIYRIGGKKTDHVVTLNEHHIYYDDIDEKIEGVLGDEFKEFVFISRHSSEAGVNSLTVHPIGNFGEAKFGGKEEKLVPCSPENMTKALLILEKNTREKDLKDHYEVSFEATHHGPFLKKPTYYIEIGSEESAWTDEKAGEVIASTVMSDELKDNVEDVGPVCICIGGGHYAPRFTDLALNRKVSIGHMVPGWGMRHITEESFEEMVQKTPRAEYLYFDRSSTTGKERKKAGSWAEDLGLEVVRSDRFENR